jgi:hypothetical protein
MIVTALFSTNPKLLPRQRHLLKRWFVHRDAQSGSCNRSRAAAEAKSHIFIG